MIHMSSVRKALIFLFVILLPHISAAESKISSKEKIIVVFGDSLIRGYGLIDQDSLPAQLEKKLKDKKYNVRVINEGVNGDTSGGGVNRLEKVLKYKPDIVMVNLGYNDARLGLLPDRTHDNMEYIIRTLSEKGIKLLICGVKAPAELGTPYARGFESIFKDLAGTYDTEFYPSLLVGVYGDSAKTMRDGVHPNAEGVKFIADKILPNIEKLLKN